MYPVVTLFGQSVQTYYLCAALAGAAGILFSRRMLRRILPGGQAILLPILTAVLALIGARLLNYLTNPDAYGTDFHVWSFSYRKLSLMGGLITGFLTVVLYCILTGRKTARILDAFVFPAAAGIVLLKLGCFLNGCCFGVPTDGPFGLIFPANQSVYSFFNSMSFVKAKSPRVHPTQLYEMAGAVIAAAAGAGLAKGRKWSDGSAAAVFVALFSLCRWLVLPIRELPYKEAVLTWVYPGLYAALMATGIVWLVLLNRRRGDSAPKQAPSDP